MAFIGPEENNTGTLYEVYTLMAVYVHFNRFIDVDTMPRIKNFVPDTLETVTLFCVKLLFGEANIASSFLLLEDG